MWVIFTAFLSSVAFCTATRQEYGLCSQVYLMSQYCSNNDATPTADVRVIEGRVGKAGVQGPRGPPGEQGLPGFLNHSYVDEKMAEKIKEVEKKFELKFAEYEATVTQSVSKLEKKLTVLTTTGCHEVNRENAKVKSATGGVFEIFPGKFKIEVVCDLTTDGGSWTVFQRRFDGSQDFNQNWNNYVRGFGDLNGEFWLGLEKLHLLTQDGRYELRIEMTDGNGVGGIATYQDFSISGSSEKYKLNIGEVSLTNLQSDRLRYHNNMAFSAKDQDNDIWKNNCAATLKGSWWFGTCHHSNLNGVYGESGGVSAGTLGMYWGSFNNIKKTEMKFRKK